MVFFPHFRPIVPIVEALAEISGWRTPADYATYFHEFFTNAAFGWCQIPTAPTNPHPATHRHRATGTEKTRACSLGISDDV